MLYELWAIAEPPDTPLAGKSRMLRNLPLGTAIAFSRSKEVSLVTATWGRGNMFKIIRAANGEVVFTVSGRLDAEDLAELKTLFGSEGSGRPIILDLKDLTRVDRGAVRFLERCEADNIELKNCPAYIREWITRERGQS